MKSKTKLIVLGGLGEVGKNMYLVEHKDEILIIDAGTLFPDDSTLGVDYIVNDISYLIENESKIKALFITHGHEDHIGSIPFLLRNLSIPVIYAPNQAKELIEIKLKDQNIRFDNLLVYDRDSHIKFKNLEVEFFRVTHSIPDAHGLYITTPNGTIVTTGDFKFDLTPIGPDADLHKMANFGEKGVTLLMSDSTNALNDGFSLSESVVDDSLQDIFKGYPNQRIIISTFASNIYRLKHIVETCYQFNKKVCVLGRSMDNNISISLKGNYIEHPEIFIKPHELKKFKDKDLVILCTGTQGEPLAALSRMAADTHKQIKLKKDDIVIFSSSEIPGNKMAINRTKNLLYLKGIKVYTYADIKVHTTGHGSKEELKLMIKLLKPNYFMPFHGEYRMLKSHANLACECGLSKDNIFLEGNGVQLIIDNGKVYKEKSIKTGEHYIDSDSLIEVQNTVLKDRKLMSKEGILVVIANLDMNNFRLLRNPSVTTRGFVLVNENEELLKAINKLAHDTIIDSLKKKEIVQTIRLNIIKKLSQYISEETGRKPVILPILLD